MLQKHEQVAEGILNVTLAVRAKDEKQAGSKMNKALKNSEGYGFKVYKSKGYSGKYELVITFKNKKGGGSYTEFDLQEDNGFYKVTFREQGYNQID